MYWSYAADSTWVTSFSSSFKDSLSGWRYLCVIREILAIIAWIILCFQGYWNVGTFYKQKIVYLRRTGRAEPRFVAEEVYRHLFFGNPYLPNGIFTYVEDEPPTAAPDTKKAS